MSVHPGFRLQFPGLFPPGTAAVNQVIVKRLSPYKEGTDGSFSVPFLCIHGNFGKQLVKWIGMMYDSISSGSPALCKV